MARGDARRARNRLGFLGQLLKVNHLWLEVVAVLRDRQLPDDDLAISVGFSVYPAVSAARLDPVAALQTE